jgi:hypothetical protein
MGDGWEEKVGEAGEEGSGVSGTSTGPMLICLSKSAARSSCSFRLLSDADSPHWLQRGFSMNAASEMDMSVICPHDGHRCKMDEDMIQKYNSILNQYCRMLGLGQLIILVFSSEVLKNQ